LRATLYLHLTGDPASTALPFRIDGAAAGGVRNAFLPDIAAAAAGARVVVLAPVSPMHFLDVELPVRSAAKARAAAPFACEEQLADDVDSLHFAVAGRSAEQRYSFAVIARETLDAWLEILSAHGLSPDVVVPDALCLPLPEEDEWVVLAMSGQALVRTGAHRAIACGSEDLPAYIALAGEQRPARLRLLGMRENTDAMPELPCEVRLQPEFGEPLDVFIRHFSAADSLNLLQGDYAPQSNMQRYLRPWRIPAALAAVVVVVMLISVFVEGWQMRRAADAQEIANLERFQQLFPGYSNVVAAQVPGLLASEMRRTGSSGPGISVIGLLESYAGAAVATEGLSLQGLQFRDRALLLNLRGDNLEALENLRGWYSEQSDVVMEVETASAGADGVQIRIRLSPA
jgi:general secretion pathway protein L